MTFRSNATLKFWNAAHFYRRAPHRDRSIAVKVLQHVASTATGRVQSRAAELLKDINDDKQSPGA